MFVKISIQDLKVLAKMAGTLKTQLSVYFPTKFASPTDVPSDSKKF